MAIKFNCSKCGQELNVKDELAGKQGKCPGCKSVMTVPSATALFNPGSSGSSARAGKNQDDDLVDADIIEDVDEVEEEEAPRKKKTSSITSGKSSSRLREDDEDDDRPRKKKSRDDDEDEDDRPSRKSSARRRDEEDDEDDRGDPERAKKKKERQRKQLWKRTGTGMLLNWAGCWVYTAACCLIFLLFLVGFIMALTGAGIGGYGPGAMMGGAGLLGILAYLVWALYAVSVILAIVGFSFSITTPGKHGEMPLAITCLSINAAIVLLSLIGFFGGVWGMLILIPLLELSRFTLFGIFQWALCRTVKDRDTAGLALKAGIMVPCVAVGGGLLVYIMTLIFAKIGGVGGGILIVIMYFLALGGWAGMMFWFTLVVGQVKDCVSRGK